MKMNVSGCDGAYSGRKLPTFRRTLVPSHIFRARFCTEVGGITRFLWNIENRLTDYMASHSVRQSILQCIFYWIIFHWLEKYRIVCYDQSYVCHQCAPGLPVGVIMLERNVYLYVQLQYAVWDWGDVCVAKQLLCSLNCL